MKLLTKPLEAKLIANYRKNLVHIERDGNTEDLKPVVKFFGGGACTWLITELDPDTNNMFGLCDIGQGFAELGNVSFDELKALKFPPFGLPVERDMWFDADKTIGEYASEARKLGRINA